MIETNESEILSNIQNARKRIQTELSKVIIGQETIIEQMIICLMARGHALITGVPGLGKTLLVKSIAQTFALSFKRIQFTPDLMPADILGTEVVEEDKATGKRHFRFVHGPIFANILLADEINRTPPKTQAALLEAMEERQVTAAGQTFLLEPPFFVLATQNPIELEGTYPLPEAQLDRFLLNVVMDYLPEADEIRMVTETTAVQKATPEKIFDPEEILEIQNWVRQVPVSEHVVSYAVRLTAATRPVAENSPGFVKDQVKWGAGSRASQALILAGKARALLHGRYTVAIEDVQALAVPVLRHRLIPNFHAEAEGITADSLIQRLLETVKE
ncbi:MAG: MoxR family ATPase [Verrucomicrobia bacterium]|nr:MoxR family ATPase [Verrucomicrobiota bacterium]